MIRSVVHREGWRPSVPLPYPLRIRCMCMECGRKFWGKGSYYDHYVKEHLYGVDNPGCRSKIDD